MDRRDNNSLEAAVRESISVVLYCPVLRRLCCSLLLDELCWNLRELLVALGRHNHDTRPSFHEQIDRAGKSKFRSNQPRMKSSTLVAILVLQAVMVMGILAHSQAADTDDDFPKCCDHCNSWSGAQFCDDVGPKCRDGCVNCRVVQTRPVKTFRCGDGRSAYPYIPCPPPCKKN